ncbi:hypothetical protein CEF21_21130 [Bacillus sp. FJAT-42376]|nr:hypothetical protein [Bacillus sp. FJAT-42376]AZB44586.1 hypothetical protein CEF21_21130 [Bacillus sp. FJAT-42376]
MKEAQTSTFSYEIGEVSKVELTKSTFVNGDDIADSVKLTNAKGIDVTNEYTVEVSSTSAKVTTIAGTVAGATENEVAYVQVTVKDAGGNTVKQSDAIKVTLAPTAVSSVANFGLGDDVNTVTGFKTALKDGDLV